MIDRYRELLEKDILTGLYNRYAYTADLVDMENSAQLAEDLVVFSIDVNELKKVNDNLGHQAGDELLQGAAQCIRKVLLDHGKCYRTGGDEFIAILQADAGKARELRLQLKEESQAWHGVQVDKLTMACGYIVASEHPGKTINELIGIADEHMYEDKARYYMQSDHNRRKSDSRKSGIIDEKRREYIDIISAFAGDLTGLYLIDRDKREVTAYRISASDHRIRNSIPLEQGFETAMEEFIIKHVHPDDKDMMRQSIQLDFIERELSHKRSFIYHFRTVSNNDVKYHFMKCIRNVEGVNYDKIIISFCPEDRLAGSRKMKELLEVGGDAQGNTILIAGSDDLNPQELMDSLGPNYNYMVANNGFHALTLLRQHYEQISCIVYPIHMQGRNAFHFLTILQMDVYLSSIPVFIQLDDKDDPEMEQQCIDLGVVDFIRKPYRSTVLRRRMDNILRMKSIISSLDEIELDELTGLYTRQAFRVHARELIDSHPEESYSIILVDVLNFKLYNSIQGEQGGDKLLKSMADYVHQVTVNGISARYGADQFVTLMKTPKIDVVQYMNAFQDYVNTYSLEPVVLKFGIYSNVDPELGVTRMCDCAMQALKSIKHNYGIQHAYYDGPVSQQQLKEQIYETSFHKALENREFQVWFQPKYNPYSERIVGAEALVRWKRPDGTLISPGDFLPVFEKDGLISQLDEYVFRHVCAQQKKWNRVDKQLIPISVNLSRNSMHRSDVVQRYRSIIEEYGLEPQMVPIEITESAAIGNEELQPLADAFNEAGFSLHMDDFGSENSSISGLSMLHFDTIKLDRSLINMIGTESGNLILMYTVALGKELGLHLVAEGVETADQVEYLKDIGCEVIQGFYYCKPVPVEEFEFRVTNSMDFMEDKYDYRYKLTAADSVVKRAMDRMLQRMPGGFLTYRLEDSRILSSNNYLWRLFGCETEEEFMFHVDGTFRGMVCPEDLEKVEHSISRQISDDDHEMDYVEYRIIRKDGTRIPVVDYGHLDHQPDGNVFYVFITEAN